jgi:alpha-L-fucosidase 2
MADGGGSYPNLLCAHPPFQLDGNMGGCAGLAELLLQTHTGTIELLPALPGEWENGYVKGLKARGGFEVNMEWKNGQLTGCQILGKKGTAGRYKYGTSFNKFTIPENGIFEMVLN